MCESSARFDDGLTLAPEQVTIVILSLAADVARVGLLWCGCRHTLGFELALASVRHEGVHEHVELDRAVVWGEGGREKGEVVV